MSRPNEALRRLGAEADARTRSRTLAERWLKNVTMANPDRSFYGFAYDPDRKKAGQFVLGFRSNAKAEVIYWVGPHRLPLCSLVRALTPRVLVYSPSRSCRAPTRSWTSSMATSFRSFVSSTFSPLFDVGADPSHTGTQCNAFKQIYLTKSAANPARLPAKTPMHPSLGGRTPGYASAAGPGPAKTPMGAGGGRTPNPYRQGGGGGMTPLPPRQGGGVTPNP